MIELRTTKAFETWIARLRDRAARKRILARLRRLSLGHPGQHRALQGGLFELKVDCGPGYRVYYLLHRRKLIILLCGGDEDSQQGDIRMARSLATELEFDRWH